MERGALKGLTTAAPVWLVAAIGIACGAGLLILAAFNIVLYFAGATGLSQVLRILRRRCVLARCNDAAEENV